MPTTRIPYSSHWCFQDHRLFLDYLAGSPVLAPLYGHLHLAAGRDGREALLEAAALQAQRVRQAEQDRGYPRALLVERLLPYHKRLGASDASLAHVRALGEAGTLVAATGQQACVAGGPMYLVYKAMGAVAAARAVEQAGIGRCVPVFWVASDDHDDEEVNHTWLLEGADVRKHRLDLDGRGRPVFDIDVAGRLPTFLDELEASLPVSADRDHVVAMLREAPGGSLGENLAGFLARLFAREGLVLAEPRLLREPAADLLERAVREHRGLAADLAEATSALEQAGYRPPIEPPDYLYLFAHRDGRRRIRVHENGVQVDGGAPCSVEDLAGQVRAEPGAWSPNVALRPVVQDHLFPTVSYAAGPTELAYYGQLGGLYRRLEVPMPVVHPRMSVTLVDAKARKTADRFGLDWPSFFAKAPDGEALQAAAGSPELEGRFDRARRGLEQTLESLEKDLQSLAPEVAGAAQPASRHMLAELDRLRDKVLRTHRESRGVGGRQLRRLLSLVFPLGKAQERVLSPLWVLSLHGPGFLSEWMDLLDPLAVEHQVVMVEREE